MATHRQVVVERFAVETQDPTLQSLEAIVDREIDECRPGGLYKLSGDITVYFQLRLTTEQISYLARRYSGKEWTVRFRYPENATVMTLK